MLRAVSVCLVLVAASAGGTTPGAEQALTVSGAWIRFIMPSSPAAGYFRLSNASDRSRVLVGAESRACGDLSLHESGMKNGMGGMVMLESVEGPAHGHVDFSPGGYHLMCEVPSKDMRRGQRVMITLRFADGEKIKADFVVRSATGM